MVSVRRRVCAEFTKVGVRGKHVLEFISNKKEFIVFFTKQETGNGDRIKTIAVLLPGSTFHWSNNSR
jgi:hypothetical protein